MTEREPRPPFQFEPEEDTGRKYRIGTVLVAVFIVVLIAWAVVLIVMEPPFEPREYIDVPPQGPAHQVE